jgi:hypothetical protein
MDCERVKNLISDYLRGALDEDIRAQVEEHLSSCPECRSEIETEKKLCFLISENSSNEPTPEYLGEFNGRLRSRLRATASILWRMMPVFVGGTIPLILAVCFLLYTRYYCFYDNWLANTPPLESTLIELLVIGVIVALAVWSMVKLIPRVTLKGIPRFAADERKLKQEISSCVHTNNALQRVLWCLPAASFLAIGVTFIWLAASEEGMYLGLPPGMRYAFAVFQFAFWAYIGYVVTSLLKKASEARRSLPPQEFRQRQRGQWSSCYSRNAKLLLAVYFLGTALPGWWLIYTSNVRLNSSALVAQAEKYAKQGNDDRAAAMLHECMRKYPNQPSVLLAYISMGDLYSREGRAAESVHAYREGVQAYTRISKLYFTDFDRMFVYEYAVGLYCRLGDKSKARAIAETHLKTAPMIDIPDLR